MLVRDSTGRRVVIKLNLVSPQRSQRSTEALNSDLCDSLCELCGEKWVLKRHIETPPCPEGPARAFGRLTRVRQRLPRKSVRGPK